MKPTKNRVYCKDSGRLKMVFETEKKANTFMKFNSEEIESESGFSPNRSYYCIYCNGWHVTSKKEARDIKSKTEIFLDQYRQNKEKRSLEKAKAAEIRKVKAEALNKHFETIEKQIEALEVAIVKGNKSNCIEILDRAFAELELTKTFNGSNKRKRFVENKLALLKNEIEKIAQ